MPREFVRRYRCNYNKIICRRVPRSFWTHAACLYPVTSSQSALIALRPSQYTTFHFQDGRAVVEGSDLPVYPSDKSIRAQETHRAREETVHQARHEAVREEE